jgi:hypothetical protein
MSGCANCKKLHVNLAMQLVHETDEVFQMIVDMFDDINHTLPRIATFIQVLGESPTLLEPAQDRQFIYPSNGWRQG